MKKSKVLFYSLDGYSTFFTDTDYFFGGIETDIAHFASSLAEYGDMEIVVVTRDHARKAESLNGITIIQHPNFKGQGYWNWRKKWKGKIAYRISGNKKADPLVFYDKIAPDVVICEGMQEGIMELVNYCEKRNKKLIYRVAGDHELKNISADGEKLNGDIHKVIQWSEQVLVQTPYQMDLLRERFKRTGILLFNPVNLKNSVESREKKYGLIWIGRSQKVKRPELFIELCSRMPELKACMVLNVLNEAYWSKLVSALPANIELHRSIPADKIENYFAASKLFISTSESEGFANAYLQAAKYGVPVISMRHDPNQMLTKHEAGILAGDSMDSLCRHVKNILADSKLYNRISSNARRYVNAFHDRDRIVEQLRDLIF